MRLPLSNHGQSDINMTSSSRVNSPEDFPVTPFPASLKPTARSRSSEETKDNESAWAQAKKKNVDRTGAGWRRNLINQVGAAQTNTATKPIGSPVFQYS